MEFESRPSCEVMTNTNHVCYIVITDYDDECCVDGAIIWSVKSFK